MICRRTMPCRIMLHRRSIRDASIPAQLSAAARAHRSRPVVGRCGRSGPASDQPRAARRRRARRLHLGRARPDSGRRPARDRGHLRDLGRRGQRGAALPTGSRAAAPRRRGKRLADFWRAVSVNGHLPDLQRGVVDRLFSFAAARPPWLGALSRFWSPYDLNPLNINPLKELIERFVDFEAIRARQRSRAVHLGDRRAHRRAARVHRATEITPEVVMASACLPLLFRAVEIDGVPYWDGGYSGNPAICPFLRATSTEDVLVVQINPRRRAQGADVDARDHEPGERAHLQRLAAVGAARGRVRRQADRPGPAAARHRRTASSGDCGCIASRWRSQAARSTAAASSTPTSSSSRRLHKLGQRATRRFLDAHFDDIGRRATIGMRGGAAGRGGVSIVHALI